MEARAELAFVERLAAECRKISERIQANVAAQSRDRPASLLTASLLPHQIDGILWLTALYELGVDAILGDDMGLGKTIQSLGILAHVADRARHDGKQQGPFLVVAPLSLLENWRVEAQRFAPSLRLLLYSGDKAAREALRTSIVDAIHALPPAKRADPELPFHILVTSYEFISSDCEFLSRFQWRYCIIDEAHRLKNSTSVLYTTLVNEYKLARKLLLTGTPVQNNITELWGLLHFVLPRLFNDIKRFEQVFGNIDWKRSRDITATTSSSTQDNQQHDDDDDDDADDGESHTTVTERRKVAALHTILRACMLRRTKDGVQLQLPEKREIVVSSGMTPMQRQFYLWILTKNAEKLSGPGALQNVIMSMRKCCNHPYLFDNAEPTFDGEFVLGEHLVEASAKLTLLDKLLARLKADGHRVLLYSQMTRMLDILQDYLDLRGFSYQRLDGSCRGIDRYEAVKNFSQEEDNFVFLLSTRAGGVGLNLVGANVVIFFDSDWNPHVDRQAIARAHRIGQLREVLVIRLITKHSIEEIILKRAMKKLHMEEAVIEKADLAAVHGTQAAATAGGTGGNDTEDDLLEAIQFGLHHVRNRDDAALTRELTEKDIERILYASATATASTMDVATTPSPNGEPAAAAAAATATSSSLPQSFDVTVTVGGSLASDQDGDDEIQESAWVFEGHDYLEENRRRDLEAFQELVAATQTNAAPSSPAADDAALDGGGRSLRRRAASPRRGTASPTQISPDTTPTTTGKKRKNADGTPAAPPKAKKQRAPKASSPRKAARVTYESLAVELPPLDENSDQVQLSLSADVDGESDARKSISHVAGDVTHPVLSSADGARIIVCCLDDSGRWGRGGLFRALDALSPLVSHVYLEAYNQEDLSLGDLHLVPVDESDAGHTTYVALAIAQQYHGPDSGSICYKSLAVCLRKLAHVALANAASVHLPRIGVSGASWYKAERAIQNIVAATGVPTYVYHYQRRPAAAGAAASVSPPYSPTTTTSTTTTAEPPSAGEPCDAPEALEPAETNTTPALDAIAERNEDAILAALLDPLPDLFVGQQMLLWRLQRAKLPLDVLERHIVAFGGEVAHSPTKATNIIVTTGSVDPDDADLHRLYERCSDDAVVVTVAYLLDSIRERTKRNVTDYLITEE